MTTKRPSERIGVHDTVAGLHTALQEYIEAQYHIRNEALIAERSALLRRPQTISQRAYVEATPVYAPGPAYNDLAIPQPAKDALTAIAALGSGVGLYPTPYCHQSEALEAFLGEEKADLIIATGTGSGKTESFLMPIIGSLAIESSERPTSREISGFRALLLYPMNALVNDQVARIRRMLGHVTANKIVRGARNRPIRFGSYTGRTPYPGHRSPQKDKSNIAPLFEEFYNKVVDNTSLLEQLVKMGRWPSKDLKGFYNAAAASQKTYKSTAKKAGQPYTDWNWTARLKTQPDDRELMTRDEIQIQCPDILVTNYSMLEYMLMRPVDAPVFEQTAAWLASDDRNELIFVLDEAHMYRGAGGAEVALLIRRLIARLGVTRDRVRFILTSASLGKGESAVEDGKRFADDLTGRQGSSSRHFRVIKGTHEERDAGMPATDRQAQALARVDVNAVTNVGVNPDAAVTTISQLAAELNWPPIATPGTGLPNYLFTQLSTFGPSNLLIGSVMGDAKSLDDLVTLITPVGDRSTATDAIDALLALCSAARRDIDGRVLMPTRLHLFYRGLPGLYACLDRNCTERMAAQQAPTILGRLHTKSLPACSCSSHSRVLPFLTHRDCGAAFVKGWVDDDVNFIWHELDAEKARDGNRRLYPIEILVDDDVNPSVATKQMWLHPVSGQLFPSLPKDDPAFRLVRIPNKDVAATRELTFDNCPVCTKKTRHKKFEPSKIMDHVTKGEAPFSQLVRAQMVYQPATRTPERAFPNEGRKVLIFSDGRQKAARLARDLPRDMELDVFRQAIAVATAMLAQHNREARPTNPALYVGFIAALHGHNLSMFDLQAKSVDDDVSHFESQYEGSLELVLNEGGWGPEPPSRYKIALLKLLCGTYYSLTGTTIGFVKPSSIAMRKLLKNDQLKALFTPEEITSLAVAWILELLSTFSFDSKLEPWMREKAYGFEGDNWSSHGKFDTVFRNALIHVTGVTTSSVEITEKAFQQALAVEDDGWYISPDAVALHIDLDLHWHQCSDCTALLPVTFRGHCIACGGKNVREVDPNIDPYVVARKAFWRRPVIEALREGSKLFSLYAEEHTAQLSNRDVKAVHSTTELHELRFQDVLIDEKERPIDVLSCTTTMEVGIDIGSLVAVSLRNVPPQRENYQQRAGRAGRRGSSVSSVVTYSQNGPHDSFYFLEPQRIVSGPPRKPELKVDNQKIARRHVHAYLVQTFFHTSPAARPSGGTAMLLKALGPTRGFFHGIDPDGLNLTAFKQWVEAKVLSSSVPLEGSIAAWLPASLDISPLSADEWVRNVATEFLEKLFDLRKTVPLPADYEWPSRINEDDDEEPVEDDDFAQEDLLEFLFFYLLLPSYAFPTSLCSFLVQKTHRNQKGFLEIRTDQMPQQSTAQSLSEYAPGRLVVINKKTYRAGGVFANTPVTEVDRAVPLFDSKTLYRPMVMCSECTYVQNNDMASDAQCPVCGGALHQAMVLRPQMFGPERGHALSESDREQDITYATMAQFPQPVNAERFEFKSAGKNLNFTYAVDKLLLTLNKGRERNGEYSGFSVCRKCGCAEVYDEIKPLSGLHQRPYLVKKSPDVPHKCDGEFSRVYLSYDFSTDLLLVRIAVKAPLVTDLSSEVTVKALEGAAQSIAEALKLATSRHPQLDLDANEFGAGFRLLPPSTAGSATLDIYLYDTLSGGGGYSELAAKYFPDIIRNTLAVLEDCDCETSCTECLDHFQNQHLKGLLDRKLGSDLLRYALDGTVPSVPTFAQQERTLMPLAVSLQLDQFAASVVSEASTGNALLDVAKGGNKVMVVPYPTLITPTQKERTKISMEFFVSEKRLRTDLPTIHSEIKAMLR